MKQEKIYLKQFGFLYLILCFMVFSQFGCGDKNQIQFQTQTEQVEPITNQETANQETTNQGIVSQETANLEEATNQDKSEDLSIEKTENLSIFYVHICGAVKNPGVYSMPEGSRIYQVVEAAGGFLPIAAKDYINQALLVSDGQKIIILSQDQVRILNEEQKTNDSSENPDNKSTNVETDGNSNGNSSGNNNVDSLSQYGETDTNTGSADTDLMNINTATVSQLTTLTGIGETRAQAIILYREKNGSFGKIEDIMKVTGIKEGLFSKFKDEICVK